MCVCVGSECQPVCVQLSEKRAREEAELAAQARGERERDGGA